MSPADFSQAKFVASSRYFPVENYFTAISFSAMYIRSRKEQAINHICISINQNLLEFQHEAPGCADLSRAACQGAFFQPGKVYYPVL